MRLLAILLGATLPVCLCACGGSGASEFDVEQNVAAYYGMQGYDPQQAGVICDESSFTDGAEAVWVCWHSEYGGKGKFAGCFLPSGEPSSVESC